MTLQKTVLIVEDDPVFRYVMQFTLQRSGLRVETASDGDKAYERLLQGGIDFLVTDHQMPICTGLELLQRLQDNSDVMRPPTIVCTARGLELDVRSLKARFNVVAVLHKPFSPRELVDLISTRLNGAALSPHFAASVPIVSAVNS